MYKVSAGDRRPGLENAARGLGTGGKSVLEVLEANAVSTMGTHSTAPVKASKKQKAVEAKIFSQSPMDMVNPTKATTTVGKHNFPAVTRSKKKSVKTATGKGARPRCTESQRHILAEGAVDISEVLLGAGLYKMIPMKNRVRLAVRKAESIRTIVEREKHDHLMRDLPTKTLPTITPTALLKWLDGEFKDVIDAVFFVDSPEEFAKLLETFAQGIADNFFGNQIKVMIEVNHTREEHFRPTTSGEGMDAAVGRGHGEIPPQTPDLPDTRHPAG
jgi:hypothetical protein